MNYFEAVQEGRRRVNDAITLLQGVAGPCYPMLFLKMGVQAWTPVGTEMLRKLIPGKDDTSALAICDADGNAKTMSAFVDRETALRYEKELAARGVPEFEGEVKLPI